MKNGGMNMKKFMKTKLAKVLSIILTLALTATTVISLNTTTAEAGFGKPGISEIQDKTLYIGDSTWEYVYADVCYSVSASAKDSSIVDVTVSGRYIYLSAKAAGNTTVNVTVKHDKSGKRTSTTSFKVTVKEPTYDHIDVRVDGTMTFDKQINGVSLEGYPFNCKAEVDSVTGTVNGNKVNFMKKTGNGIENEFRYNGKVKTSDEITLTITGKTYTEKTIVTGPFWNQNVETVRTYGDSFTYTHTYTAAELTQAVDNCPTNEGFDINLDGKDISNEIHKKVTVHYYAAGTTDKIAEDAVFEAATGTTQTITIPTVSGTVAGIEEGHYTTMSDNKTVTDSIDVTVGDSDSEVIVYYVPEGKTTTTINFYEKEFGVDDFELIGTSSVTDYISNDAVLDVYAPSFDEYTVTGTDLDITGDTVTVSSGSTINVYYTENAKAAATVTFYVKAWNSENRTQLGDAFVSGYAYDGKTVSVDVSEFDYTSDHYTIDTDTDYTFGSTKLTFTVDTDSDNCYEVTFVENAKYLLTVNYYATDYEGNTSLLGSKTSDYFYAGETAGADIIGAEWEAEHFTTDVPDGLSLGTEASAVISADSDNSYDVYYIEDAKNTVVFNYMQEEIKEDGTTEYVPVKDEDGNDLVLEYTDYVGETVEFMGNEAPANHEYASTTAAEIKDDGEVTGFEAVVKEDSNEYYVYYDLLRYTVTYNYYDGKEYKVVEDVPYGMTLKALKGMSRASLNNNFDKDSIAATITKYYFANWITDNNAKIKQEASFTVTSDMTLTASFTSSVLSTKFFVINPEYPVPAGTAPEPVKNFTTGKVGTIDYFKTPGSDDPDYVYGTIMTSPDDMNGTYFTNKAGNKVTLNLDYSKQYIRWYVVKDEDDGLHVDGYIATYPTLTYVLDGEVIKTEVNKVSYDTDFAYSKELDGTPADVTDNNGSFSGWMLEDGTAVSSVENQTTDLTVYGTSTYTTTIDYVYADGSTAADSVVLSGNIGETFEAVTSPVIENYTATETSIAADKLTIVKGNKTITVVYNENDKNSVIIDYVYADGSTAADSVVLTNYVGKYASDSAVTSPVIDKYAADIETVNADEMIISDEVTRITVTYTKNVYNVTVNYEFAENASYAGATLPESVTYDVKVGDNVITDASLVSIELEGCDIQSVSEYNEVMGENDVTITVTYAVKTFTVTYLVNDEYVDSITVTYGTDISNLMDLEYTPAEGYAFSGWSTDYEGAITSDVTIAGTTRQSEVEGDIEEDDDDADDDKDNEVIDDDDDDKKGEVEGDEDKTDTNPDKKGEVEADTDTSDRNIFPIMSAVAALMSGVCTVYLLTKKKDEEEA